MKSLNCNCDDRVIFLHFKRIFSELLLPFLIMLNLDGTERFSSAYGKETKGESLYKLWWMPSRSEGCSQISSPTATCSKLGYQVRISTMHVVRWPPGKGAGWIPDLACCSFWNWLLTWSWLSLGVSLKTCILSFVFIYCYLTEHLIPHCT